MSAQLKGYQLDRKHQVYPPLYYRPDNIELRDIWSTSVCPYTKVLLFGDSIIKYVKKLNNTQVVAFRGIHIEELAVRVLQDKIPHLPGKRLIVTHVGTNNVTNDSPDEMVNKTKFLIDAIRQKNSEALIVLSLIIPRPIDYSERAERVKQYNHKIIKMAAHLGVNHIPTYRKFMYAKSPKMDLYAVDDLHLKDTGTLVLQQYFEDSLGDFRLAAKVKKTKRAPPDTLIMQRIKKPRKY